MRSETRRGRISFDPHDRPAYGLVYLAFAYVSVLFMPEPWVALAATLAATALFLPVYFAFHRRSDRDGLPWILATAAIGYALSAFSTGGSTFVIYALAMAAIALRPRAAIAWGAALGLLYGPLQWLSLPLLRVVLPLSLFTLLLGGIIIASILLARARNRDLAALQLSQDEVRRLAALAERERIGRDLHDLLGHTLSVVALKSELAGKLIERDPPAAREQIRDVEQVARSALSQVREAVAGIRAAGLQAELASARLALLAADVQLDQRLAPLALDGEREQALALALREAITNIIRHAQARRVEIELAPESDGTLRLVIADDGRGGIEHRGTGLTGMRERVQAVGGTLELDSERGAGTRLTLRVPRVSETAA